MMVIAVLIGGGSLLLFGVFLVIGPIPIVRFGATERQALAWDAMLSVLFFIQHSVMIRASFRTWLSPIVPRRYRPSTYAITSGIALTGVVLLWQPSQTVLYRAEGLLRLLARAVSVFAVVGFSWGVQVLESLDAFGLNPVRASLRGKPLRAPVFIVRGPYLWVRHPLYFFVLVLIWSAPDVGLDRLLFNVFWTLWIVFGTYLEEKDLVAEFGEKYRHYQKTVPMLFPWRFPRGSKP
ncbi:MAG: isoprenylcysteine carboxylmethyltransferase family protein [Deltaproteobacteria bacterium]|nr:isoprenylcysteine carboxylmethyltransferase family protein [Deltaproteobacteria bacterium]